MSKIIAVRGRKEIVAVLSRYAKLSGNPDQGRPQSMADIIRFTASLPISEETKRQLIAASKYSVDISGIDEAPASIKIPVDVDEQEWDRAMSIFKYVFSLKNNPQMPFFIRVAGMAAIKSREKENAELGVIETPKDAISIERFQELSIDDKLTQIYRLLLERKY